MEAVRPLRNCLKLAPSTALLVLSRETGGVERCSWQRSSGPLCAVNDPACEAGWGGEGNEVEVPSSPRC